MGKEDVEAEEKEKYKCVAQIMRTDDTKEWGKKSKDTEI